MAWRDGFDSVSVLGDRTFSRCWRLGRRRPSAVRDAAVLAAVQDAARRARQGIITGTLTREPALQFSELFPMCLSALS
jgi:hypothetical protein